MIEKIKKVVLREDLIAITGCFQEAIILNQFIYWSERVSDVDKLIEQENEIARRNGEVEREPLCGWIYKTSEDLAVEIMLGISPSQIRRYIKNLVGAGYLYKRNNPKYKWDRTLQYRVNLVAIAVALNEKGYPFSEYKIDVLPQNAVKSSNAHVCAIKDAPTKNQTRVHERAIPEITTDITTKTTKEKHNSVVSPHYSEILDNTKAICKSASEITDEEEAELVKVISYFLIKYKFETHTDHPNILPTTLRRIIDVLRVPNDELAELLLSGQYPLLIDRHFQTDYGQYTDYRLPHFATDGIISFQARNVGLAIGVDGEFNG